MEENDRNLLEMNDVSEPQDPRTRREIEKEEIAEYRREWLRSHKSLIFIGVGAILVAVIVFIFFMYFRGVNPVNLFSSAVYKDFSKPFHYTISLTEDGENKMHYDGTIAVDRAKHTVEALYEADYNDYTYTGAVTSDGGTATAGNFYKNQWTTHDCTDMVQNFFDFDNDFGRGGFDCGAFLRFTGLTSKFSIRESAALLSTIKQRLSTDSTIAKITIDESEQGNRYHYDINLYELFDLVQQEGASAFYSAPDYDAFCKSVQNNRSILEQSKCTMDFFITADGYLTTFDLSITAQDRTYGLSCELSEFGTAEVVLPKEFLKAAEPPAPTEPFTVAKATTATTVTAATEPR